MKRLLLAAVLAASTVPAMAQVGISVNIGEPGFFGQIDLGDAPRPETIYAQPVVVDRSRGYDDSPVYLRVPQGREQHWKQYCGQYHACNRPVYFVRNDWYTNVYAPHYRNEHGHPDDRDHDRGHDDHGHEDRGHDDHGRGHDDHDHGHDDHDRH